LALSFAEAAKEAVPAASSKIATYAGFAPYVALRYSNYVLGSAFKGKP